MTRTKAWSHALLGTGITLLGLFVGCSRQPEGDRCSTDNNHNDCEGSLVCVSADELRNNDGVARCCPAVGQPVSTSRCVRSGGSGGSGPDGGAGQAGAAGAP